MAARKSREEPPKRRARRGSRSAAGGLVDLSQLSEQELRDLSSSIERELAGRREQKRRELIASIRSQAQALGVAPEELAAELARKPRRGAAGAAEHGAADGRTNGAADGRSKVKPKYRNPNDPTQTWAGRGVKPRWMQALLAQGASMEDFRIES